MIRENKIIKWNEKGKNVKGGGRERDRERKKKGEREEEKKERKEREREKEYYNKILYFVDHPLLDGYLK